MNQLAPKLLRFSKSGLTLSASAEDVRGYIVIDEKGASVGHVEDLLIDDSEKRVRFLLVGDGGFLGIGEHRILIPVDAVGRIHKNHVHISKGREHIAKAPLYDPKLDHDQQAPIFPKVLGYYGFLPFWAAGYSYPGFPYYV
ncbi:MAG TPA: PRC-barrel domain-containing protein [Tepidisphaeraceae bacterium]